MPLKSLLFVNCDYTGLCETLREIVA